MITKEDIIDLIKEINCCVMETSFSVAEKIDKYETKRYLMENYSYDDTLEFDYIDTKSDEIFVEEAVSSGEIYTFTDADRDKYMDLLKKYKYDFRTNEKYIGSLNRKLAEYVTSGYCASCYAKHRASIKLHDLRYVADTDIEKGYVHKDKMTKRLMEELNTAKSEGKTPFIYKYRIIDFNTIPDDPDPNKALIYFYFNLPRNPMTVKYLRAVVVEQKINKLDELFENYVNSRKEAGKEPHPDKVKLYNDRKGSYIRYLDKMGYKRNEVSNEEFMKRVEAQKTSIKQDDRICGWHLYKSSSMDPILHKMIEEDTKHKSTIIPDFSNLSDSITKIADYYDIHDKHRHD